MFDSPVVTVRIPASLRLYTAGRSEITASGETVAEILDSVGHECPSIRSHLFSSDGGLASDFVFYVGGISAAEMQGMLTPVTGDESLSIVPLLHN